MCCEIVHRKCALLAFLQLIAQHVSLNHVEIKNVCNFCPEYFNIDHIFVCSVRMQFLGLLWTDDLFVVVRWWSEAIDVILVNWDIHKKEFITYKLNVHSLLHFVTLEDEVVFFNYACLYFVECIKCHYCTELFLVWTCVGILAFSVWNASIQIWNLNLLYVFQ
jgi:hypothetical protein